jgi:hypothetical protein
VPRPPSVVAANQPILPKRDVVGDLAHLTSPVMAGSTVRALAGPSANIRLCREARTQARRRAGSGRGDGDVGATAGAGQHLRLG